MRIAGTGSAIPKKVVTNEMLSEFLETSDEWIPSRTGIRERRVLSDEKFEELAAEAAGKALADAGISDGAVDLIFVFDGDFALYYAFAGQCFAGRAENPLQLSC